MECAANLNFASLQLLRSYHGLLASSPINAAISQPINVEQTAMHSWEPQ